MHFGWLWTLRESQSVVPDRSVRPLAINPATVAPSAIKPAHGSVGYAGEHQSGALAHPGYERWSGVNRLRRQQPMAPFPMEWGRQRERFFGRGSV